jgi:hypothetical protein
MSAAFVTTSAAAFTILFITPDAVVVRFLAMGHLRGGKNHYFPN